MKDAIWLQDTDNSRHDVCVCRCFIYFTIYRKEENDNVTEPVLEVGTASLKERRAQTKIGSHFCSYNEKNEHESNDKM